MSEAATGSLRRRGATSDDVTQAASAGHRERGEFAGASKRRRGPYSAARCAEAAPAELIKGIQEFNDGDFFDQHETLELLWRATEDDVRYLYQGILLVGVGFHHASRGNYHGTEAKLSAGIDMLRWFAPVCQTVDVATLIADASHCLTTIRQLGREGLSRYDLSNAPRIRLLA